MPGSAPRKRMLKRTMTGHASPILTTLLDTDAYKLHMQQAVYHRYYDVPVTAEFRCRSDEQLGQYADAIRTHITAMQSLALSDDEYRYLSSLPFFQQDYLDWLRQFRFDASQVEVRDDHGHLRIQIRGPWREVILWEVPLLALI
ncbi:nicotinate phosphoribosyltransferase, partial [Pantoea dispersa]